MYRDIWYPGDVSNLPLSDLRTAAIFSSLIVSQRIPELPQRVYIASRALTHLDVNDR
jgi:hypothetical protein